MGNLKGVLNGKFTYGDITATVMYWTGSQAIVANAQAIADAVRAIYAPAMASVSNTFGYQGMTFYDLDNPGTPGVAVQFTSGVLNGTTSADPVPAQIALLLGFKSNTTRPNRKRIYVPALTEGNITGGLWVSGVLTTWGTVAGKLIDFPTYAAVNADFATVWQTAEGLISVNVLELAQAFSVPATQRRRRRGQGA